MPLTLQDIFKAKNKVTYSDTFLSSTLEQIAKQFIGEITGEKQFSEVIQSLMTLSPLSTDSGPMR